MAAADETERGNFDERKEDAMYRRRRIGYYSLLFSDDEHLARMALKELVQNDQITINQAAHWAMNLGDDRLTNTLYTRLGTGSMRNRLRLEA